MPTPRRHPAVAAIDGLLYVAGGTQQGPGPGALTTLEVYNPVSNTWTTKASLPAPRVAMASGVIDGKLYRGWAEFGHLVVDQDGKPCQGNCTGRGHLESYCTGVAASEAAREEFGPAADAHRLIRLAREGDERAKEILATIGHRLGAGIGSLVNVFHPETVVIGGGFGVVAFEFLLDAVRKAVEQEALSRAGFDLRIVPAELGTAAGVIGAGLVAFEALA